MAGVEKKESFKSFRRTLRIWLWNSGKCVVGKKALFCLHCTHVHVCAFTCVHSGWRYIYIHTRITVLHLVARWESVCNGLLRKGGMFVLYATQLCSNEIVIGCSSGYYDVWRELI